PLYPLCGHSTTIAALSQFRAAVEAEEGWHPEIVELAGWHRHPGFYAVHADNIRAFVGREGLDLADPATAFLFSVHGTPIRYLEGGNRYDRYVEEACAGIAARLGLARYHVGYQNHSNRPVEWTQPDVEVVVKGLDGEHVVVMPLAFLHEQSETLAELDRELRDEAEDAGLHFHRVPVPHDSPRVVSLLADLVEAGTGYGAGSSRVQLRQCLCRTGGHARCTNGLRLESTVVPAEEAKRRA
ncbi:MAG TPA: ferrochelatase, partial [Longimicrobiales bacterium]|nr:ferrochelatase [Longimicrobiales bacterium]